MNLRSSSSQIRGFAPTVAVVALWLCGCAGPTYTPDEAPRFAVLRERVDFFRQGPLQPDPPDERLPQDTSVRMLRREFGYSLVMLEDGRTGYVANDDLVARPEVAFEDRERDTGLDFETPEPPARTSEAGRSSVRDVIVDDAPLPDFGELPDDLPVIPMEP